jgi:FkbM family methyltransferase
MRFRFSVTRDSFLPSTLRARRALKRERLLMTDFGPWKLHYHSSSVIGRAVAEGRGWEPTLGVAIDRLLPREEPLLIADVGSNIGTSLAQMISVRPHAKYVCFEPAERFRELLLLNTAQNGWENVVVEEHLVGAQPGTVSLYTNTSTSSVARRDYGGHVFLRASERRVVTLDQYFRDADRVDMIKSDTDGFDVDVLYGADEVLKRFAPLLYFEFAPFLARDVGRNSAELLAYLRDLKYRTFLLFAQSGAPLALTDDSATVLELADQHQYVDVLTAAQVSQVAILPGVADAADAGRSP